MTFLKQLFSTGQKNEIADKLVPPLPEIKNKVSVPVEEMNIDRKEFLDWQKKYFPEGERIFKTPMHKKMLELFVSFKLLRIGPYDVYLDAAGGQYSYASRVECEEKYIQDIRISDKLKKIHGNKVKYLDCPCSDIWLAGESVNKISCHHSIEHFQQDGDILFIQEVQRLLRMGGRCVILPLFISFNPILLTDKKRFKKWDESGIWIPDTTATLPGGKGSGHFARVYSIETFETRLMFAIREPIFNARIIELKMDGVPIPNPQLFMTPDQAKMNLAYRVLVIDRIYASEL